MANDVRKCETLVRVDDKDVAIWEEVGFMDLKFGDIFRMYEPTGEPVIDDGGFSQFIARSNARFIDNIPTVESLPLTRVS